MPSFMLSRLLPKSQRAGLPSVSRRDDVDARRVVVHWPQPETDA